MILGVIAGQSGGIVPDAPAENQLLTEAGDVVITESADPIILDE